MEKKYKDKIIEMLNERGEITNNNVENMLGVSDASATNYLDGLEKEGKIVQVGTIGRSVKYKLK